MTWTRILASGSGAVAWRCSIEGWLYDFVTHRSMEQTAGDGRLWKVGLKSDTFRFSEHVDLASAEWKVESFPIKIADVKHQMTAAFHTAPSVVTYLDEPSGLNDSATTITVKSTAGFASSGTFHLDTEAITYTSKNATQFLGCTRGALQTLAQYHYSPDGDRMRFPEITDVPQILEGRRVRLWAYGSGESLTGTGTMVYMGVARTEPRYDGAAWSFQVDPPTAILDAELGSDLEDPCSIRGIYYPATAPMIIRVTERDGADRGGSATLAEIEFAMAGFWATQEEFCDALTDELATQMVTVPAFTQDVTARPDGAAWSFVFVTAATPNHHFMICEVHSAVDGGADPLPVGLGTAAGGHVGAVAASTAYKYPVSQGLVPRATLGHESSLIRAAERLPDANRVNINPVTFPPYRLYIGGGAAVTSSTTEIAVEWESIGAGGQDPFIASIDTVNTTDRYIESSGRPWRARPGGPTYYAASGPNGAPAIRLGRSYGFGSLIDFLAAVAGETAQFLNTGAVPDFRTSDYDVGELWTPAATSPLTHRRTYTVFAETNLKEMIEHECRLLGVYPCSNATGGITFRRLRLPSPGEVGAALTASSVVVSNDKILSYERNAEGLFNTFRLLTGYDPIEDEHTGTPIKVRDVSAYGLSPAARVIEVAPKSMDPYGGAQFDDVLNVASRILGIFGGPYSYLTIEVPITHWATLLGTAVSITWSKVPNSTGGLGVTDKIGLVVGRKRDPMHGSGEFTILLTDQRIGGYVPAYRIDTITGTTGTTGPFVVKPVAGYLKAGTDPTDFWTAGDKIRVYKWNAATAGTVLGTVDSVAVDGLTITMDAAWTRGAFTWCIGSRVSTAVSAAGQKRFVYEADSSMLLDWSDETDLPPFTFGP